MKSLKLLVAIVTVLIAVAFAYQKRTINGRVVDSAQKPVSAATVQVKGTADAVGTDAAGRFSITVSNDNAVLIVTAAGFDQQEIKVGKSSELKIVLQQTKTTLDEVVVIGYGTEVRRNITGAVASIAPAALLKRKQWYHNTDFDREGYESYKENPFLKVKGNPLSTFSIDVDGAAYSNIRRFLNEGQLPPDGSVRIEEMINYFNYDYPQPKGNLPFSINTEYTTCPWNPDHQLVSIGLQGKKIPMENLPASNLVFLIDVSGSMESPDKLPLVQASLKLLTDQLRSNDKIAIVVYAGNAGLVLPATEGNNKIKIKDAIDKLQAGGSTAGGAGINLAYSVAAANFIKGGNNRVILCTDGDFNVGASSDAAMEALIEGKRASGIFLSVLGYGAGNYQDAKMQKLADKGNGNHAYIDNLNEARKVLIHQFGGTLFTIAKDVKLQVEFNPLLVQGYRLIGYENRMLAKEDFNDDKKDAGDLGSGHTVTALYEIIPVGIQSPELKAVDDLKYQKPATVPAETPSGELMTVKFRYKNPDGAKSLLLQTTVGGVPQTFKEATDNIHLSAALAQFGMLLRNSEYKGRGGYQLSKQIVARLKKSDPGGYQKELLTLIGKAQALSQQEGDVSVLGKGVSGE